MKERAQLVWGQLLWSGGSLKGSFEDVDLILPHSTLGHCTVCFETCVLNAAIAEPWLSKECSWALKV